MDVRALAPSWFRSAWRPTDARVEPRPVARGCVVLTWGWRTADAEHRVESVPLAQAQFERMTLSHVLDAYALPATAHLRTVYQQTVDARTAEIDPWVERGSE